MRVFFRTLFIILLFVSCRSTQNESDYKNLKRVDIRHAKGFNIFEGEGYKVVEVTNPWDSTKLLNRYLLVSKDAPLPDDLPKGVVVRTPVDDFVVYSVVDGAVIDLLGNSDDIVAVCEAQYFKTPAIKADIESGKIVNLGQSAMPAIEKMVALAPKAIFATAFQNSGYGAAEKLDIPIIEGASYMESAQLGQSEWMRFLAAFLEKEELADSIFTAIESRYMDVKKIAEGAKERPSILIGKRFGSAWYVPSGESYKARMYRDAAASYEWYETVGSGSLSLSFEEVFSKARDADVWIINYNDPKRDMTYNDLKKEYKHYADFSPFEKRKIFGCNTANVNYYESVIFSPDLLLRDYIKILHPELCEDFEFTYFKPLE